MFEKIAATETEPLKGFKAQHFQLRGMEATCEKEYVTDTPDKNIFYELIG